MSKRPRPGARPISVTVQAVPTADNRERLARAIALLLAAAARAGEDSNCASTPSGSLLRPEDGEVSAP